MAPAAAKKIARANRHAVWSLSPRCTGACPEEGASRRSTMFETCPVCGGTAVLQQMREEFHEIPDLAGVTDMIKVRVKVEEFKCQDRSCEHEFEKVIREPSV